MSFESMPMPCFLPAKFSSVTPLYDRSLLSAALHNAVPLPLPVFNLGPSSPIELPTVTIPSPVPRGKKSSNSLTTNSVSVLASSDSSPLLKSLLPHHRTQLQRAWATSPRIPTVNSRRAWANARNVSPLAVHAWFHSRKRRSKIRNQPIGEGTYDLAVGNPNDGLDIKEETHPYTFLLSPAADSSLSTPTLSTLSLSTPSLSTPSPVTNGFLPWSSPPSPTVPIVSAKKPICPKKVAAKSKTSATSLPTARVRVRKARNPHLQELQATFDLPFDPRLGFLFADAPCSIKTFPRFPSWQECSTLSGDVDVYLNLLPAPQSNSSLPMSFSQTETDNLGMLKDAFSGAERRS